MAAVVLGALAMANVPNAGQSVIIRPAAQGGLTAGTMFVSNIGSFEQVKGGLLTPGFISVYPPGTSSPEAMITKGLFAPFVIAVDASGSLWVVNGDGNAVPDYPTVVEYDRSELAKATCWGAKACSPAPTVTLDMPNCPVELAFDPSGDLWAGTMHCGTGHLGPLEEFTKAELAKSGSPVPVLTLNQAGCGFAFDSSGDLWEASGGSSDAVSEWAKAQLAPRGSAAAAAPRVRITSPALHSPCSPGFDRTGDLWVANANNTFVEFTNAQLAKSGATAPKVVISSVIGGGGTFDASGNLWLVYQGLTDRVEEFTKSELVKSGAPAPAKTVLRGLYNPFGIAFEP